MNHSDIAALMKGAAPAIRDLVVGIVDPLVGRIGDLESQLAETRASIPAPVTVPAIPTLQEIRDLVDQQIAKAAPEPVDVESLVTQVHARVTGDLDSVRKAIAEIPPAPELPDVAGMISKAIDNIGKVDLSGFATIEALAAMEEAVSGRSLSAADVGAQIDERLPAAISRALPPPEPLPDIAALVRDEVSGAIAKIPPAEPGKSVTLDDVRPLLEEMVTVAVRAIPTPERGKDADPAEVLRLVNETVERTLAGWEKPKDGDSVTVDDVRPVLEELVRSIPPAEPGKEGSPGKLPIVRAWLDTVHREGDVVSHAGATWQAMRDTGKEPPHADWICLAAAGRPGKDADEIEVKGTFDPDANYRRLNIVVLNGNAFMARSDDPGPCPGAGWQVIAMRGKPGEAKKGDKGDTVKGPPGAPVARMTVDGEGMLTLVNGDGSTVDCDLYPVLAKIRGA